MSSFKTTLEHNRPWFLFPENLPENGVWTEVPTSAQT